MARAERYNRGKSWRDKFLKSKKQKEKKKDNKPIFVTEDDLFKRIGSGNDYSTERFYDWNIMLSNHILDKEYEEPKMRSLKDLCAMQIAEHHDLINHELLKNGNWSIWAPVWKYIVRWRRDNFKTFQTFADAFHRSSEFACHGNVRSYPSSRFKTLLSNTAQDTKRHRVERLFSNIKLTNLISNLNNSWFPHLTVLEISKDLQDDELLELTNLTNLTALKITQTNGMKDTIVNSWCSALKSQKWTRLQVLCLPRVSESSLIKLQRQVMNSRLLYIEIETGSSRFNIDKEWPNLDRTHWELIKERSIIEQPLALKFQSLLLLQRIENRSLIPTSSTILLDFNILDKEFVDYGGLVSQTEYDSLWNMGEVKGCYLGLLLKKLPKFENTVKKATGVKRLKTNPKPKVTSLNSFFDL
ncbi:hypothetical protein WICANDRAFT_77893 [Wickerhamomyces anomalus NRRL Y-366-8]|uniref:Uncharacterized protein n=1 Tax=Wickerhamomyces anomalus (strain ATCC 58044 / CBS 1984 / NCYC 433 / NRRL Y-366-8) TaxID=683960 RepID=A0A1E3P741_WICAA|nr:uncharacterized protein WICANDRAFT_77893 [Wickerhamomyces anomalus NRRL Y-366-8]ODQ61251.1 hypothetical protein WICANDRAFT_77893 [Wickerhamomyces anomalus NRRL Y-366-8]